MKSNKNVFLTALILVALTAGAWAQTETASNAAPSHGPAAAATPAPTPVTAADIQELRAALAAQQQQIQALQAQLQSHPKANCRTKTRPRSKVQSVSPASAPTQPSGRTCTVGGIPQPVPTVASNLQDPPAQTGITRTLAAPTNVFGTLSDKSKASGPSHSAATCAFAQNPSSVDPPISPWIVRAPAYAPALTPSPRSGNNSAPASPSPAATSTIPQRPIRLSLASTPARRLL